MPAIEIPCKFIIFDPKVQTYCNNPKFKCPNYAHSWACPPEAPYLEKEITEFQKFFLIYYQFNINEYIREVRKKHPRKSEHSIRNSLYRQDIARDYLDLEISSFLESYKEPIDKKLVLWDGYCRVCSKEGKLCSYDLDEPCRYPHNKRFSMEAVGINVDKTVRNLKIPLEWPPINYVYRFGLVCIK